MEDKDTFEVYRSLVRSEEEQMHRRLSWLGSFQGFLFAALAFAWGKNKHLTLIICWLGLVVAVLVFTSVFAGSAALSRIRRRWNEHRPSDYKGPDIFGLYPARPRFYNLFSSEAVLPLVFVFAWMAILLIREPAVPVNATSAITKPDKMQGVATALAIAPTPTDHKYLYADAPTSTHYPNPWVVLPSIGYESAYDETFRNPAWVAYHLSGTPNSGVVGKRSPYAIDSRTVSEVGGDDYPTGYDNGHMAPNQAIALFFGDQAQKETFLMTNMLPQRPGLNRGPWKTIESNERLTWVKSNHEIWVIDGPVYTTTDDEPVNPSNRYGAKQVCIPVACFKVVMTADGSSSVRTLAFIMPQEDANGNKPETFLTSIREIERRTGLNFFSSLSQDRQDEIETKVAPALWP